MLSAALKSRAVRRLAHGALSAWQYAAGDSPSLHELGLVAWRELIRHAPPRDGLLLCDDLAESPLELPFDARALVTSVAAARLEHFDDVLREAEVLARSPDVERAFDAMIRGRDRYDFRLHLNPRQVTDPRNATFVKFAMQPRIAGLARKYLRVPCRLSEVTVMLDRPTTSAPRESQNWHRDPDDWSQLSAFVYLSDVDSRTAPFCYVPLPESRRLYGKVGRFRTFDTWHVIPDGAMERFISRAHWNEVVGPKGTVTFIDSAACYHRGKRAEAGPRLSLHLIFTSTLSRMEMRSPWGDLVSGEPRRIYASESPAYTVASAAPRRGA